MAILRLVRRRFAEQRDFPDPNFLRKKDFSAREIKKFNLLIFSLILGLSENNISAFILGLSENNISANCFYTKDF